MSILAITMLLLVGTVFGISMTLWLIRKLGRTAYRSKLAEGLFLKITAFRPPIAKMERMPPSETPRDAELDLTPQSRDDDDKVLASVLREQLGFTPDETQKALSVVQATIPNGTLENKIVIALRSLCSRDLVGKGG